MKHQPYLKGVSVIICCYNSARRIKLVLNALLKQEITIGFNWEVILVDNACKDDTSIVAAATWNAANTTIPLHIIQEPHPGLANARNTGIKKAMYEYLVFCDDDNLLCPNYIEQGFISLKANEKIGACGGCGVPLFETREPKWFKNYAEAFATGSQMINQEEGRLLSLYGAGLAIKKSAIETIWSSGFKPVMDGRMGSSLSSSEDIEMTYALVLLGYELSYNAKMVFQHYLPLRRLNYSYLKNLFIEFGKDGPVRNLYYANISHRFFHSHLKNWYFHLLLSIFRLIKYYIKPPKVGARHIYLYWNKSYIKSLFAIKRNYTNLQNNINKLINYRNQMKPLVQLDEITA